MKKSTGSYLLFFILLSFFSIGQPARRVKNISENDTNRIVAINYPSITNREGKGLNIPIPPADHPRLYLRSSDIPTLQKKITDPQFKDCWDKIIRSADRLTDGILQRNGNQANLDISVRNAIEAKAFLSVLNADKKLAREAINALLNFYATLNIDLAKQDMTRDIGRCIVTGAMVYDWCYYQLTQHEKEVLIGRMETLGTHMELKWPDLVEGSVVGHGTEAELSRDILSFGIATYNEKPIIYNLAAGRIISEFLPVRNLFYAASYHHQGSSYGIYRYGWDLYATLIFDKMGYPKIFGEDQVKPAYYWLYLRRPDGQLLRNGDDFNELFIPYGNYWNNSSSMYALAGSYFKDPILVNEGLKEKKISGEMDYLFDFLFLNSNLPDKKNKTSLALTKYFKEPLGAMIARTGWEDDLKSNNVVAEMKIGVRSFGNHEHLDAGSFQLYYKGPLAIQSGIYQGSTGGYAGSHFINYSQRSIAHNTMLFYDPAEKFYWNNTEISNDGGQRYPSNGDEPKNLEQVLKNDYKIGEVLGHYFGPDSLHPEFSYLKGQLAPAYTSKVKSFKRSFVFLNLGDSAVPAALIVFDNVVTANKNVKKYWLLHSVEEPILEGNNSIIARSEKGYDGKMINTTLLPIKENLQINKVGGLGNEFSVFGKNYPQISTNAGRNSVDSAMWRIEVSPIKAATNDLFLNVMQVMDIEGHQLLAVGKLETEKLIGTQIGDRVVFFSKNGDIISDEFKFTITGNGSFKVLITDLQEGNWTFKKENSNGESKEIKSAQYIYSTLNAGKYIFTKMR